MSSFGTVQFEMGSEVVQAHPKLLVKGKRYSEPLAGHCHREIKDSKHVVGQCVAGVERRCLAQPVPSRV